MIPSPVALLKPLHQAWVVIPSRMDTRVYNVGPQQRCKLVYKAQRLVRYKHTTNHSYWSHKPTSLSWMSYKSQYITIFRGKINSFLWFPEFPMVSHIVWNRVIRFSICSDPKALKLLCLSRGYVRYQWFMIFSGDTRIIHIHICYIYYSMYIYI